MSWITSEQYLSIDKKDLNPILQQLAEYKTIYDNKMVTQKQKASHLVKCLRHPIPLSGNLHKKAMKLYNNKLPTFNLSNHQNLNNLLGNAFHLIKDVRMWDSAPRLALFQTDYLSRDRYILTDLMLDVGNTIPFSTPWIYRFQGKHLFVLKDLEQALQSLMNTIRNLHKNKKPSRTNSLLEEEYGEEYWEWKMERRLMRFKKLLSIIFWELPYEAKIFSPFTFIDFIVRLSTYAGIDSRMIVNRWWGILCLLGGSWMVLGKELEKSNSQWSMWKYLMKTEHLPPYLSECQSLFLKLRRTEGMVEFGRAFYEENEVLRNNLLIELDDLMGDLDKLLNKRLPGLYESINKTALSEVFLGTLSKPELMVDNLMQWELMKPLLILLEDRLEHIYSKLILSFFKG